MSVGGVEATLFMKIRDDLNFFRSVVATRVCKLQVICDGYAMCICRMAGEGEEREATEHRHGSPKQSGIWTATRRRYLQRRRHM